MFKTEIIKGKDSSFLKQKAKIIDNIPESKNDRFIEFQTGQSLSKLAKKYYGSDKLWRVIALANGLTTNYPPIGTSLRIPSNPEINYVEE